MSMHSRTTETSVALSLADLTRIEEERVEQERAEQARTREQRARAARETEAKRRADEASAVAAAAEAEARRARDAAIEKARLEARERAAADVVRIEAEAKARLEADNAVRAHELAVLRVRRETGRRRREWVLGAALAIVACLGGAVTYDATERASELETTAREHRDRERALGEEHEGAKRTELAALDRRHTALLARAAAKDAGDARATAEAARAAIDERAPGHDRLRAFADSLDALQAQIESNEKLATLERRHADLDAWAASIRRSQAADAARSAAARAKAPGAGSEALAAYERALDQLRTKLAERAGGGASAIGNDTTVTVTGTCQPGDPGCGLDGKPLF